MPQGKVKWFDNRKGYGFIIEDGREDEDIFVHFSAIRADGYRTLEEQEPVMFEIIRGPKGLQAKNVERVGASVRSDQE